MIKYFLLATGALFLLGCTSAEEEQLEQLQIEVLAVHDEIMPEMGTLNDLKTQLLEQNEALKVSQDSTVADQVIINEMVVAQLDQAHESMMAWMRQFQKIDSKDPLEDNKSYLEDQMLQIQQVKLQIDQAILAGREALGEQEI